MKRENPNIWLFKVNILTSFGAINAGMAGIEQNLDHLTLVSGFAGFSSVLFGGMPLETIISGTAAAPWPVIGNIAVLVILAVLLIFGVVTKISKYMPTQSIAGFLVIIGIFSTFLPQLRNPGFASDIPVAGITMAVTKLTNNPFIGVLAGLATRAFGYLIGLA
jgi:AGZA family xanthine/uracil permease-like MFS transporter